MVSGEIRNIRHDTTAVRIDTAAMKTSTHNRHADAIERVIARLSSAIEAGDPLPDLPALAAVAHLSPYHFHRVYRALTGEPLGATVTRLRLSRAVHLLGEEARSVTDVALLLGYDSSQTLARVFRERLGSTPGAVQGDPELRAVLLRQLAGDVTRSLSPAAITHEEGPAMSITIVEFDPLVVIARRNVGSHASLNGGFQALFEWAGEHGLVEHVQHLVGIPVDDWRDVPPDALRFDCCIALDRAFDADGGLPDALRAVELAGGCYAQVRHVGAFDGLEQAADIALRQLLDDGGHALRDAPVFYIYRDDPEDVAEALLRSDILIPLEDVRGTSRAA